MVLEVEHALPFNGEQKTSSKSPVIGFGLAGE
jgi:hypothetical protein